MSTPVKTGIGSLAIIVLLVAGWLVRPLFVDSVVDEALPLSAVGSASSSVALTGTIAGADDFHQGSGVATVHTAEDGSRLLRLEDFEVTNGPDLRVFLAPIGSSGAPDPEDPDAIELGRLKGNIGDQNYEIPADADLDQPLGVVIYCVPFKVVFATALLA